MRTRNLLGASLATVLCVVGLAGCGDDDGGTGGTPGPERILFTSPNAQPEGIEYDAVRGVYLVGSITEGTLRRVSDDGAVEVLNAAPGLAGTTGLHIDTRRDRLLAVGSLQDAGMALGEYDLQTGEVFRVVGLDDAVGPGGLANDVVTDASGNAYVTDTAHGAVLRVDPQGNVNVLARDALLAGANGIEIIADRVLLVALLAGTRLIRVPIDAPLELAAIDSDTDVSGDGIVLDKAGDLAVVGGFLNRNEVLLLHSEDEWHTAQRIGRWDTAAVEPESATTAAVRGHDVYAIFARLFDETVQSYQIVRAVFDE